MENNVYSDLTFVYFDYPIDNRNLELEDFDTHRASFSGDNTADALLHGLESFGYLNRENYIKNGLDLDVDAILKFVGLDDLSSGHNGDNKDFILFIEDDLGNYILDYTPVVNDWLSCFVDIK